jgi:hypothetical protein
MSIRQLFRQVRARVARPQLEALSAICQVHEIKPG